VALNILLTFVLFLLVGCSSVLIQKVWVDEFIDTGSITSDTIMQGGVKIVGSTNTLYSNLNSNEVIELNEVVKSTFLAKHKPENFKDLNKEPRFYLNYTILNNKTSRSQSETDESICYKTYREMKIRLHILDRTTEVAAWGGVINKKTYKKNCNSRSISENESLGGFFFETLFSSVVESVVDSAIGTYPEAPSVNSISKKIFSDFLKMLPASAPASQAS
jgi:hypothetical protein